VYREIKGEDQMSSHRKHSKKKVSSDPKPQTIPLFGCNPDGRITDILTKNHGWMPIRVANAYYLQNVLDLIEYSGKKFNKLWYAIDQELKRRQSASEIKPRSYEASLD
jgi:hypothetical protein